MLTVTPTQICALEQASRQAATNLNKAVVSEGSDTYKDVSRLYGILAKSNYDGLGKLLGFGGLGLDDFMDWNRGTQRADAFDRYMLQYALGSPLALRLSGSDTLREGVLDPTEDSLRAAIRDKEGNYSQIWTMAGELADKEGCGVVMGVLYSVQNDFPRPFDPISVDL